MMPLRARSLAYAVLLSATALASAACDDGGSSGPGGGQAATGDSGDGKYHPEPNGTHISETAACETLTKKQENKLLELGCVGTGQTCPSFLRAQFQTACMEYDQGSVSGCVAYYDQQTSCTALKNAYDTCSITPYPGTEPAGCPMTTGSGGTGGTGTSTSTTGTGGSGGGGTTTTTGSSGSGGMATSGSSSSGL